jgi:hypothetical protein
VGRELVKRSLYSLMIGILAFNLLMIGFAIAVATGMLPSGRVSTLLGWLHGIIGITTPGLEKTRLVALIWIGSTIVIVDGLIALLVFLTAHLM